MSGVEQVSRNAAPITSGETRRYTALSSKAKKLSERVISAAGPKAETLSESAVTAGRPVVHFPPERFIVCRSISARLFSSAPESGRLSAAIGITQGNDHAPYSPAENSEALQALNDMRMSRCGTRARSCKESLGMLLTALDNIESKGFGVLHAISAVEMHAVNPGP